MNVIETHHTDETWRRPGVGGWILVGLSAFVGLLSPVTTTSSIAPWSSYSAWMLLFVPAAFGFGFVLAPLFARALENQSTHEWSKYLWVVSGLAPLALLLAAFLASVAAGSLDWSYLVNAACPLGISAALAFRHDPLEGTRNIL